MKLERLELIILESFDRLLLLKFNKKKLENQSELHISPTGI